MNGLIGAEAFRKPGVPYYLTEGATGAIIRQPTLVSAIDLESADGTAVAQLSVVGLEGSPPALSVYSGSIGLRPGTSSLGAAPAGVNIRSLANGVAVEVGTDGAGIVNTLGVAGATGVGQVYDEIYNQPVQLQTIAKQQIAPLIAPANPEEVLRGGQAAIAAAIATPGSQTNFFQVPRTGAYMVQTEIAVGNAGVPNTVVIPSTLVAGVPIWKSISLAFAVQGGPSVPYASFEVIGGDFYGDQAFASSSFITKTFTSVAILTAGVQYYVALNCEAGWNIGDGGQIKTELIAMC